MREEDVEAHDGLNVVLTIDSVIQHYVEIGAGGGDAEVFAHQRFGHRDPPADGGDTGDGNCCRIMTRTIPGRYRTRARMKNRVVVDVAEPGSTYKSVVVSSALSDGIVKLTDQFDCEHGRFTYAGRVLHDHVSLGVETVEGIIAKSSNIGAAKIGILMGEQRLYQHLRDFGFGERTGNPIAGGIARDFA